MVLFNSLSLFHLFSFFEMQKYRNYCEKGGEKFTHWNVKVKRDSKRLIHLPGQILCH